MVSECKRLVGIRRLSCELLLLLVPGLRRVEASLSDLVSQNTWLVQFGPSYAQYLGLVLVLRGVRVVLAALLGSFFVDVMVNGFHCLLEIFALPCSVSFRSSLLAELASPVGPCKRMIADNVLEGVILARILFVCVLAHCLVCILVLRCIWVPHLIWLVRLLIVRLHLVDKTDI